MTPHDTAMMDQRKPSLRDVENTPLLDAEAKAIDGFAQGTMQIWKSRIGWRITFVVFMTIVLVYSGVVFFTISEHKQSRLESLRELGQATLAPLLDLPPVGEAVTVSPLSSEEVIRLIGTSRVIGLSLYDENLKHIKSYGQPVTLLIEGYDFLNESRRTEGGASYEFILKPNELVAPYYAAIKMDSSELSRSMNLLLVQHIFIAFALSALVTNVLMITLGRWLLSPILVLRQNLISATRNPDNPYIQMIQTDPDSEIGGALEAARTLIMQNANNLREIKNKAESEIHKLAYYDSLTGLPNRELFLKLLREKASEKGEGSTKNRIAVITMDLDHFKDINDSMGHHIGDIILNEVGKRLRNNLPKNAVVSRYGEDEFALLVPLQTDLNKSLDVAKRVAHIVRSEPFKAFDEDFQIRASIGVATYPDDSSDPDHVVKGADVALNRAKEEGRDTIRAYSRDFDIAVRERFQTLRDLRVALDEQQLRLFYQPQFDLKTGKLVGVESLVRWWKPDDSPQGGHFISPGAFIPIAENSGLIVPMGEWILRHACERGQAWRVLGLPHIRVAVNISGAQFSQSNLPLLVRKVLEETEFPAHALELEVTESLFMDDVEHTIATLHELNKLGLELAIDDFGTGYSSLSYLRQFPIHRLKIDRSFIDNAATDADDGAITRTIIGLGRSLNLEVIAEGVETLEQQEYLIKEGCDLVQGFRYAKPMPEDKLIEFLKAYTGDFSFFDKKA